MLSSVENKMGPLSSIFELIKYYLENLTIPKFF